MKSPTKPQLDSTGSRPSPPSAALQLPTVALVGAPKCGTSSLFYWLTAHPQVCGSSPKEPFYFMDERSPLMRPTANYNRHGYSRYTFFPPSQGPQAPHPTVFLEATTHSLYQQTALDAFASWTPQPHIIVLLRQPSDRILSSFRYTQHNLACLDPEVSFADFVALLLEGQLEQIRDRFTSNTSFYVLSRDLHYSCYVNFLTRWAERFPPDRLHLLTFESLRANPQSVVSHLAATLGLDPAFFEGFDFQSQNTTTAIAHSWLHRQCRRVAPMLPKGGMKSALKSLYFTLQRHQTSFSGSDDDALRRLDDYFEPWNRLLAEAFQMDLSEWSRVSPSIIRPTNLSQ
ncbi:MAG: sulfotransferase domain-containing protein [Synechococcales bacterium]|nr:sulfotransferase domain-containing protein [Synechococcales bacterium]